MTSRIRFAAAVLLCAAATLSSACGKDATGPGPGPNDEGRPPSSYDLIDAAHAQGRIDEETALLQKIFAATSDDRLRAEFRDPVADVRIDVPPMLPLLLRGAAERLPRLSLAGQRVLVGFFQPPAYEGSAWSAPAGGAAGAAARPGIGGSARLFARGIAPSQASRSDDPVPGPDPIPKDGWRFVDAPSIPVRVWVPTGGNPKFTPERVIQILEAEVWGKLTELMQREPVPDAGVHEIEMEDGSIVSWGDGGNGRFDIYLIGMGGRGNGGAVVMNYPPSCSAAPAFMLLDPYRNESRLGPVLAHEFFHALQFAFSRTVPCDAAWDEATGEWASHYVYPRWDDEPATWLIGNQNSSLGSESYGGWLFNAFLQHAQSPELVRATYERYGAHAHAMQALDAAIPGGLATQWSAYARHAWNQGPAGRPFVDWEGIAAVPSHPEAVFSYTTGKHDRPFAIDTVELDGKSRRTWQSDSPEEALTRRYAYWIVPDDRVRWVEFTNPAVGKPVSMQAYVKIAGQDWRLEDWSNRRTVAFCRDVPGERIDSVVTIMADYTLPSRQWQSPGKAETEARSACPEEYSILVNTWTDTEKRGRTYDILYSAVVRSDRDQDELAGKGEYAGTIITHKANCHNGEPDESETFQVAGKLDATATAGLLDASDPNSPKLFGYTLATLDWLFMPLLGRLAETEEEKDAVRGLGSVGSGLDPLKLPRGGGRVERTDTNWTTEDDCSGKVYHVTNTVVNFNGTGS